MLSPDAARRFWAKVDKTGATGCWEWTAAKYKDGYGNFRFDEHNHRAHRLSYEYLVGPIPAGLVIDHLCRNIVCVNPDHLEPVTPRENILRGQTLPAANARKTHCAHGHPLSGPNLYLEPKNGKRHCRICRAANLAKHKARAA
jgi:hypothetical protein